MATSAPRSHRDRTTNLAQTMLSGIIHAIAKHDHAHTPGDFRPIHLFAITYRLWASIGTKQTLRQMQALVPEAAYGFLPRHDTARVWMAIQTWIEHAVNFDTKLCGLSTDLNGCFNNIEAPNIPDCRAPRCFVKNHWAMEILSQLL